MMLCRSGELSETTRLLVDRARELDIPVLVESEREMRRMSAGEVDYISPFAYIASEILDHWAAWQGAQLSWKPVELLALSSFEHGLPYSPSKRAYVAVDASRSAEYHDVRIAPPRPFPVESKAALLLAIVAQERNAFPAFHRAVFRAAWLERCDIGTDEVLSRCVQTAGGDPTDWLVRARSSSVGGT